MIIIFACLNDKINDSMSKSKIKLESEDLCLEDLVNVLREAAVHLYENEKKKTDLIEIDENNSKENIKMEIKGEKKLKSDNDNPSGTLQIINGKGDLGKESEEEREQQRKLLVDWSTSIGLLLEGEGEGEGEGVGERVEEVEEIEA